LKQFVRSLKGELVPLDPELKVVLVPLNSSKWVASQSGATLSVTGFDELKPCANPHVRHLRLLGKENKKRFEIDTSEFQNGLYTSKRKLTFDEFGVAWRRNLLRALKPSRV
jgi:hypothetical protein